MACIATSISKLSLCSGYHATFTRLRSWVQSPASALFFLAWCLEPQVMSMVGFPTRPLSRQRCERFLTQPVTIEGGGSWGGSRKRRRALAVVVLNFGFDMLDRGCVCVAMRVCVPPLTECFSSLHCLRQTRQRVSSSMRRASTAGTHPLDCRVRNPRCVRSLTAAVLGLHTVSSGKLTVRGGFPDWSNPSTGLQVASEVGDDLRVKSCGA